MPSYSELKAEEEIQSNINLNETTQSMSHSLLQFETLPKKEEENLNFELFNEVNKINESLVKINSLINVSLILLICSKHHRRTIKSIKM
jgi:hypothetical protein